jgi:hypothetical protein
MSSKNKPAKTKAEELFNIGFMFDSMAEMRKAIDDERSKGLKELQKENRTCIFEAGEQTLLTVNDKGRFGNHEEPHWLGSGRYPTKQEIINAIDTIVEEFKDNVPPFDVVTDSAFYYYESHKDKFDGVEKEHTGEYYGVTIFSYTGK